MVSAWASANNLVLAQRKTGAKSNEITTIPQLLAALELSGTVVAIDAIGCQKAIAQQIAPRRRLGPWITSSDSFALLIKMRLPGQRYSPARLSSQRGVTFARKFAGIFSNRIAASKDRRTYPVASSGCQEVVTNIGRSLVNYDVLRIGAEE